MVDKLSNGNVEQPLWSFLLLEYNSDTKNYIYNQLVKPDESQLNKLLENVRKCVNNTVAHNRYEWAMAVVATMRGRKQVQVKGFNLGKKAWDRAWRLYTSKM